MKLRHEEQLSAEALQRHLQNEHGIPSSWEGVDAERPDLRFTVIRCNRWRETWAVEVTSLVQYIDWDGKEGNRRLFEPAIFNMVKCLNQELGPQMKSGYWLEVVGPLERRIFCDLERRVRQYISSGKTEQEALDGPELYASAVNEIGNDPNDPLVQSIVEQLVRSRTKITIKAVAGTPGITGLSGLSGVAKIPGSDTFAADIDATLHYAVNRILDKKLPRMATVHGYDRKILLVWNAIPFAHAPDVKNVFLSKDTTGIDGIFFFEYSADRVSLITNSGLI
jgi:hypothetical protein